MTDTPTIEATQKEVEKMLEEFPFNLLSPEAKQKLIERSKQWETELQRLKRLEQEKAL